MPAKLAPVFACARCDSLEVFELVEEVLDQVTPLVRRVVLFTAPLPWGAPERAGMAQVIPPGAPVIVIDRAQPTTRPAKSRPT